MPSSQPEDVCRPEAGTSSVVPAATVPALDRGAADPPATGATRVSGSWVPLDIAGPQQEERGDVGRRSPRRQKPAPGGGDDAVRGVRVVRLGPLRCECVSTHLAPVGSRRPETPPPREGGVDGGSGCSSLSPPGLEHFRL